MSDPKDLLTTNAKALAINLDGKKYGTIAEIGAGQEVARYFFQAGHASGTIAKTMSAYDMSFSDAIYGKAPRYVSSDRLVHMLDHEYGLLTERLDGTRGERTAFFAFADTVATKNSKGSNEAHGWMGVRFQINPREETNDIILHVRMWDKENVLQQQALGIIGVNLIYGAFFYRDDPKKLIQSLIDNLSADRIEVDMLKFSGPAFANVDTASRRSTSSSAASPTPSCSAPTAASSSRPRSFIARPSLSNAAASGPSPTSTSTCSAAPARSSSRNRPSRARTSSCSWKSPCTTCSRAGN